MTKLEQKKLLKSAAEEMRLLIDDVNVANLRKAKASSLGEPDRYDYQTCYDLMVLSEEI